jgi:allantoicase
MIPDGGIARFRVYGTIPPPPLGLGVNEYATSGEEDPALNALDLAHVLNGGRVVFTSDQHFGIGPNVLLPGRGKDMGDGWETKRSRLPGHKDWLIIKLGEPGLLSYAEIDTNHFLGNFPESVELHAILSEGNQLPDETSEWTPILPRSKTGPGKQHYFPLTNVKDKPYSHVRVTMHPDGGIKRVRIVGRRSGPLQHYSKELSSIPVPEKGLPILPSKSFNGLTTAIGKMFGPSTPSINSHGYLGARNISPSSAPLTLKPTPASSSNFTAYGDVISYAADRISKSVNQGTAQKQERLSDIVSSYPASSQAKPSIHVYRCQGVESSSIQVKVLERHQFTKQAFIPLSKGADATQKGYLVIVAKNGSGE